MKKIPLTRGLFALVDDEDYKELSKYKWHTQKRQSGHLYAGRAVSVSGVHKIVSMHRAILGLTDSSVKVDHIDGNGLNNCRANIRTCTQAQNVMNQRLSKANTSSYKGVYWSKSHKSYMARIQINNKLIYLGQFDCPVEAARHYNLAAKLNFQDFANMNDVSPLFPKNTYKIHLSSSGFRGVCWDEKSKKWRAYIGSNKQRTCIGMFSDKIEAARAYDSKAKEWYGDKAKLNFQ